MVLPCLILCYLGQGARIVANEDVLPNVFYLTIPGATAGPFYLDYICFGSVGYRWSLMTPDSLLTLTIACPAQIVASHGLITASFALVQQVMSAKVHLSPLVRLALDDLMLDPLVLSNSQNSPCFRCRFGCHSYSFNKVGFQDFSSECGIDSHFHSYLIMVTVIGVVLGFGTSAAL